MWFKYIQLNDRSTTRPSTTTTSNSTEELVRKVGRHILIDTHASPTIATVQDPTVLRQQNPIFYQDAEAGDRLLIWPDKAILYSERKDQLLSILPILQTNSSTVSTVSTNTSTTPLDNATDNAEFEHGTIEIRNGTRTRGLAGKLSAALLSTNSFPFHVIDARDALRKNYQKTLLIQRTDQPLPQTIQKLQDILQAEVTSTTPSVEAGVKGNVLIIIGADYQQ